MDIMDKLDGALKVAADKAKDATDRAKGAADRAKELAEIAGLKSQIATCETVRKKNYAEIGKLYYERYGKEPDALFEKQCRSIANAEKGIEELKKKIEELK